MKLNEEIPKNNPFRVPEGYFDRLTERTISAIREDTPEGEAAIQPNRRIRLMPYLALAAAIIGFALLATVIIRVMTADRASAKFTEENSLYADLLIDELDTYMIEDELFMTEAAASTGTEQTIAPETIIDYLMTEDIDLNDIYELL